MTNSPLPAARPAANRAQDAADTLPTDPTLLPVAAELFHQATRADDIADLAQNTFPTIAATLGADYVALAAPSEGRWTLIVDSGIAKPLPTDLLAEVLDRETAHGQSNWVAAPLATRTADAEVLVIHYSAPPSPSMPQNKRETTLTRLAPAVYQTVNAVRRAAANRHRMRRLEAILEIASQWNQTHEVEPLLTQMAEAATRLLHADRASIFLWDRPNHTLVGRPALGLPGGELRIPDDRGVVGQVIQSGQPRRVDAGIDPAAVDRQIDAQLRYQTRTLLCVPLRGRSGELFGAFELINKLVGSFTKEDEEALTELAAHAAVALENAQDREQLLLANRQIADAAA